MSANRIEFHGQPEISEDHARVDYTVSTAAGDVHGHTIVTDRGDRVRVETFLDDRCILSHKLDPNEEDDSFQTLAAEIKWARAITIPVLTDNTEHIAVVAHNLVISGRPEWG